MRFARKMPVLKRAASDQARVRFRILGDRFYDTTVDAPSQSVPERCLYQEAQSGDVIVRQTRPGQNDVLSDVVHRNRHRHVIENHK